ncbi:M48 family metallopeptidase [Actinophytocola sp.]|uniref:M48 family metallopeptidase n=1 Tax=Actinophytocola sp. TaxID=1872138 RepID=UPI003D6B8AFC
MNFFERQRVVRRISRRFVVLFVIAVLAIVAVIDVVAVLAYGTQRPAWDIVVQVLWVSALVIAGIGLTSLVRTHLLSEWGGGGVAERLGGVLVPSDTTDPRLRRLRNVVEEMAIASGVPVPEIYLLPNENRINAFAAGFSPADAAIAVTHGALERLNRDELQGVIAHEFSHIVHGDMRLNIRLMGTLFGILVLAIVGRLMFNTRRRPPLVIIGLALIVVGYVGVFFGRMIKAAVSRQREYLADASAVQYTRQTAGLAGALKKIGGLGSQLRSGRAEDVSHMLFGEGFRAMFATHPPLVDRIWVLEPTFDRRQLDVLSRRWAQDPPSGLAEDEALGLAGGGSTRPAGPAPDPLPAADALPAPEARIPVRPDDVVTSIGSVGSSGATVLDAIPAQLLDHARDPETVLPLVFGLLLAHDPRSRANQLTVLTDHYGDGFAEATRAATSRLAELHPGLRLPLAEVAFPALRRRPRAEREAAVACVQALIHVDGRIDVFEYCLSRLLHRELYESTHRSAPWQGRRTPREVAQRAAARLFALLAQAGSDDPEVAGGAYVAGLSRLVPGKPIPFDPPTEGAVALEEAWPALDALEGLEKEFLVAGMVTVIGHDGVMTVSEIELLRTVCALLRCPLPPLGQAQPEQVVPDPGQRS